MSNILIAYFSRAGENYVGGSIRRLEVGNTEIAAKMIAELTGGELYKIEPAVPYSDLHMTCIEEAKRDLQAGARPALKAMPESISQYDTVYLCYPNYWGTMPMAVCTFLEAFDFTGKTHSSPLHERGQRTWQQRSGHSPPLPRRGAETRTCSDGRAGRQRP
jgi:flavodoxin